MSTPIVQYQTYQQATSSQTNQADVRTKEYYVRVSKSRKKYHALKFNTGTVDLTQFNKPEMSRDTSNIPSARADWEAMPKSGQGSEYNRENKELARRRKFGYVPKKVQADDLPWVITNKGNEKEKTKEKQYIGKKSISENSCYFVFIKCADGGFEAHPLEDWYSFAPHKTYKTLDIDEAEEEFKRRHKILNKYLIMANKRKAEEGDEDEEEDDKVKAKETKKTTKKNNLIDEEDDNKKKIKRKPKKRSDNDEEEARDMEDSDDGDQEGREKDYSDTGSEDEEPDIDTQKYDEKYEPKGVDEEEAIKAMERSTDEEEGEEDEELTEEGKEYKKLMSKKDEEDEEFDEFFKTGKIGKEDQEDSKDSSSSFDDLDLDENSQQGKKSKSAEQGKMKRKATDNLQKTSKKLQKTASGGLQNHDESSSSSSTSTAQTSKAQRTAAIIAAVQAKTSQPAPSPTPKESSVLTEEEVRRYLSRKPMTTKELLHKFRGKTQDKMSKEELCQSLKTILDKLNAKISEKNGVKYLSLS